MTAERPWWAEDEEGVKAQAELYALSSGIDLDSWKERAQKEYR